MEFAELILIPKVDRATLIAPLKQPIDGTLCISGHHIIFSSRKHGEEELWLLHKNVDSVERRANSAGTGGIVILKCKDFRQIQLHILGNDEFNKVATTIERLSSLELTTLLYPFFYRSMGSILEDGWTAFRPETEFAQLVASSDEWRISHINQDYSICPTYANAVVVPKTVTDHMLIAAASFRERGRFPVLSYRHENGSALMRSSQPLTGPGGRRCKEDEALINSVLGPGKRGYIVDTRSTSLAQSAKSRGGGFELEMHYPQWRRINKPIDRHHSLLDSLTKLIEACNETNASTDRWLSRLEGSGWLNNIKDTLNCACLVAQCLDKEGASVLVHGSEGLDGTLLVTSLAQVILNPDCRTVRGMEALVEREWLQAGYPFTTRHQKGAYALTANGRTKHNAPTFLLFLDCVSQIHYQFPCSFEFTTGFLICLFEHSYASQYGTFLGNCEADRERLKVRHKTVSLWSYLNGPEILQLYLNPMYDPNNKVIWPSVAPMSFTLWSELYLRWVVDQSNQRQVCEMMNALKSKDKELRLKVHRFRRQLAELEREALGWGIIKCANQELAITGVGGGDQEKRPATKTNEEKHDD